MNLVLLLWYFTPIANFLVLLFAAQIIFLSFYKIQLSHMTYRPHFEPLINKDFKMHEGNIIIAITFNI